MSGWGAKSWIWLAGAMLTAAFCLPVSLGAQAPRPMPSSNTLTQMNADENTREVQEKVFQQNAGDPKEEAAFKKVQRAQEPAQKIKLGQDFINKYPSSLHLESVYQTVAGAYYEKQDLSDFYNYADQGISHFPDDVSLLAMTGWVIPRAYNRDDPDADKKLDKAETYEKHAMEVMKTLQKPASVSDQEFDQYKVQESVTAHSALGLIYFRRERYDDSVKELQQATQGASSPDPTDLLVLGADYHNLSQYKQAADAFNRCAQIAGSLQSTCKQNADDATKLAAQSR
jgi:tetratricopeptide (TPR) repeat protein